MKVFGFVRRSEKFFVHVTCNVIIGITLLTIFAFSIFSPVASQAYVSMGGAIYNGDKSSNNVCLMINVYWGTEYLSSMLETLAKHNIKTTFFVGGCWVAKNNEMLQKIYSMGHEIGNHGYFHKDHAKLSSAKNQDEIYMTQELVRAVCGAEMDLFAPPSGSVNDKVVSTAAKLGYKTIMWSRDTIDWRDKDRNLIFRRATEKTVGGDLILMHPTEKTAEALDDIITTLKSKGLCLTTVSQTINPK